MNAKDLTLRERLQGLAGFLSEFSAPNFKFGEWAGGELRENGVRTMPFYRFGEAGDRLITACYDLGWVRNDFAWSGWSATPEAERLMGPAGVESASVKDLERLITWVVRADRFCEGSLAGAFESGLLLRILRRVAELERSHR